MTLLRFGSSGVWPSTVLAGLVAVLGAAEACSSFSAQPADASDGGEGGSDALAPTPDGDVDAAQDAPADAPDAGTCALASAPTIVASAMGKLTKVATDGENVFWTEGTARLMRASLLDCTIHNVDNGNIESFAVSSSHVVWSTPTYRGLARNDLGATPFANNTLLDQSLILPDEAYWLGPGTAINACPTPCVSTTVTETIGSPRLLAANASRIFFFGVDQDGGTTVDLWSHVRLGAATESLAKNQNPTLLAASSSQVFWVTTSGGLFSVGVAGGPPALMATVPGAAAIAADEANVYVATATAIVSVPVAASVAKPVMVAAGQQRPVSIALTSDQVIWANADEGTIRRIKK